MGALGNQGDNRIFVNTFKGYFTTKAKDGDEGAIKRTNKLNVDVWERQFNSMSDVVLQDIKRYDSDEYGFSWNVYLKHKDGELYTLTLPYSGRITMGLFFSLPNMDLEKEFTLRIAMFSDEKTNMWVLQNEKKVIRFWNKENQKDMPDLEKTMKDGKEAWDSSKRMAYTEKYLAEKITPKLVGINQPETAQTQDAVTDKKDNDQKPSAQFAQPEWDAEAKCLKKPHEDGNYYECSENGDFKRDQQGKLVAALPF